MVQTTLALDTPLSAFPAGVIYRPGSLNSGEQAGLAAALGGIFAAAPLARARTKSGGMTSAAMTN
jgi:hypothetical protein